MSYYIHSQSVLEHARSLQRAILVVLRNNCVINLSTASLDVRISSLEISRSLYLQQQLLITIDSAVQSRNSLKVNIPSVMTKTEKRKKVPLTLHKDIFLNPKIILFKR